MVRFLLVFFCVVAYANQSICASSNAEILKDPSLLKFYSISDSIMDTSNDEVENSNAATLYYSIMEIEDDAARKKEEMMEYGDYIKSFMSQLHKKRINKNDGSLSVRKMKKMSKRLNPKKNKVDCTKF